MLPNSNTSNYIQSRLGLQQPRSAPGPSRIRSVTSVPPKREGIVWSSVTVLSEHATSQQVECNNCSKIFCGGATRIREHTVN